MKLIFVNSNICLNGSIVSNYNIEKGERLDFICIPQNSEVFNSSIYFSRDKLIAKDFDIVTDNAIYLFTKKRQNNLRVYCQEEFYSGNNQILVTVFFDGKTYCSIETNSKYNVISLPNNGNNYSVSLSSFADNIFLTFDLNGSKCIKVINMTNFECVFEATAKNVETDGNRITLKSEPKGVYERVTESVYVLENEVVQRESNVHKCTPVNVRTDALLGVIFLEAAEVEDFDSILSILDEDLKSSIDDLKSLFSGTCDFYPIPTKDDTFIVTKNDKKELYKFVYENGKIVDIMTE